MASRRRARKTFPWRTLGVLTVVGAIAILCGWLINTLLLQGYLWAPVEQIEGPIGVLPGEDAKKQPQQAVEEAANIRVEVNLPAVSFYLTQVGAVGTEAGASAVVANMKEEGNAAAYHYDGELYRVFAGIFKQREAADATSKMFKSMQIDAFTKEVAWPVSKGTLTGAVGSYYKSVDSAVQAMHATFMDMLNAQNLGRQEVDAMRSLLQEAEASLGKAEPTVDVTALHQELTDACVKLKYTVDALHRFITTSDDNSRFASEGGLIEFGDQYRIFAARLRDLLT